MWNLFLQHWIQIKVRKGIEHRHNYSRVLLKQFLESFNHSLVILIADDLRQRSNYLFLQMQRANRKNLHQFLGQCIRINKKIQPPEVIDDQPSDVVFEGQRRTGILRIHVEIFWKLLEKHVLNLQLDSGHQQQVAEYALASGGGGENPENVGAIFR